MGEGRCGEARSGGTDSRGYGANHRRNGARKEAPPARAGAMRFRKAMAAWEHGCRRANWAMEERRMPVRALGRSQSSIGFGRPRMFVEERRMPVRALRPNSFCAGSASPGVEERRMPVRALRPKRRPRRGSIPLVEERRMTVRALRLASGLTAESESPRGGTKNARQGIETARSESTPPLLRPVEERRMPVRALRPKTRRKRASASPPGGGTKNARQGIETLTVVCIVAVIPHVEERRMPVRALRHFTPPSLENTPQGGGTKNARQGIETWLDDPVVARSNDL